MDVGCDWVGLIHFWIIKSVGHLDLDNNSVFLQNHDGKTTDLKEKMDVN